MNNETLQRKPIVLSRTGLSNSTLYYFINEGTFPKPVKLGKRTVAWKKSEIDEWIDSREYSMEEKIVNKVKEQLCLKNKTPL